MALYDIKQISIRDYLEKLGFRPEKQNERRGMFQSPIREDKNASFSVDYIKNLWFDHGVGEGGSIIDLVSRLEHCSIGEAVKRLENDTFSFCRNNFIIEGNMVNKESSIQLLDIQPLSHPALLDYLTERSINTQTAQRCCSEVRYSVNNNTYFAIGFPNDAGGYDLRNNYFKGCTSKDITTKDLGSKRCFVFEGFMDYLSYLTIKKGNQPDANIIVLNSVSTLPKAWNYLKSHKEIYTFLDNDDAGRKATEQIKSVCPLVYDQSPKYSQYKDLNDLLCGKKVVNACKHENKPSRLHEGMTSVSHSAPKKKTGRRMKF